MSVDKTRIRKQMEYINNTFIEGPQQNTFFGKNATQEDPTTIIPYILDYDTFKDSFLPSSYTINNTTLTNIKIQKTDNGWTNASVYTNNKGINITAQGFVYDYNIKSFNFTDLIKSFSAAPTIKTTFKNNTDTSVSFTVIQLLDAIRTAYNLLEPSTWRKYQTLNEETSFNIQKYSMSGTDYTTIRVTATDKNALFTQVHSIINNIDDPSMIKSIDMIRRVLHGYEHMIHIYIAGYLYENASETEKPKYKNILETVIRHFNLLNNNFYNEQVDDGIRVLYRELESRTKNYRDAKSNITVVNDKIEDVKEDIQREKNYIDSHKDFYEKSQGLFYIFMFIFLVALAYLVIGTARGNQRMTSAIVFAISIISMMVLYSLTEYVMVEPFNTPDNLLSLYMMLSVDTVYADYINNTINIIQTIDTYRMYGDVSKSISKEHKYYSNLHTQLANDKEKLNAVQMNYYREGRILRYRIYMFFQVLAVISLFMIANNNSAFVYVPAAFVVLFVIYLYIFNVNNLVRTDSRKYYWGEATV